MSGNEMAVAVGAAQLESQTVDSSGQIAGWTISGERLLTVMTKYIKFVEFIR